MINSFISLVAKDVLRVTAGDLKECAIVFPNRRSGALFRRELAAQIQSPAWSPGIFAIDDWLVEISGLATTSRLMELATLYRVVQQKLNLAGSFGDFMDLGETMLADFDDVDKYLVDPNKLFTVLGEIRKIDSQFDLVADEELVERIRVFWGSFGAGRSSHQEKWLAIWDKMHDIYLGFQGNMMEKGLGTSGMCYRKAAEDLLKATDPSTGNKRVFLVGFNILTLAEEAVFGSLRDNGKALFYWDYHPSYLEPPHEAGRFITRYLQLFPPPEGFQPFPDGSWNFFDSSDPAPVVRVVPVTSNTGQVQALLRDLEHRPPMNRGIVLSDESLFSDLLSSWPDDTMQVNFSSGFPLRDTQAASFFSRLTGVILDFHSSPANGYCKSGLIQSFLKHPWSGWLTGDASDSLIQLIRRRFPESVPADFVIGDKRLAPWIGPVGLEEEFPDRIRHAGIRLLEFDPFLSKIEKAGIKSVSTQIDAFTAVLRSCNLVPDGKTWSKLFAQFLNADKISLETDRNACNQVVGVLETRLMDFDEVFILSFNEGIWPSKSLPGSLIPYSMRKIFSLPTAENRDAMYSYYFYRLVQRAAILNLYYLTGHLDDVIRSGEKSRYLAQLQYESGKPLEFRSEPPVRAAAASAPIIIRKEGVAYAQLSRYLSGHQNPRSLSPSALNEYLDCPLRFALKRIYDLAEPDEIAYVSGPKGFGTLIHQVMNRLYMGFVGMEAGPDPDWLNGVIRDQEGLSGMIFGEYNLVLKETGVLQPGGKELLGIEVVRQMLTRILEFDREILPQSILGLEERIAMDYPISLGDQLVIVNLGGIVDRMDQVADGIRIIDYKTGNVELNARSVEDLFNRELPKRPKEVFQVLLYCEFLARRNSLSGVLIPCLFRVGRFQAGDLDHRVKIAGEEVVFAGVRDDFNQGLKKVLEELFDPEIPFVQCEDVQVCRWCPYKDICSREG